MRRLLVSITVAVLLLLCTSPVVRGGTDHAAGTQRAYAYGSGPRQRLVVYRDSDHDRDGTPGKGEPRARRPAVVLLHGGYWFRARRHGQNAWAQRIADSGAAVFDVDYRRNLDAPWPAQRADVLRAVQWIRDRAVMFGVDPARVVLVGISSGGHVATAVGTYGAGRQRFAGVVGLSPIVDPYRAWRSGLTRTGAARRGQREAQRMLALRTNAVLLAGCEPGRGTPRARARCRHVWRDMAPAVHASGRDDPPMLLIHSRDDFVPAAHSAALRDAERSRGMGPGEITVVTVPGGGHGTTLLRKPGVERRIRDWIAAHTRARHG